MLQILLDITELKPINYFYCYSTSSQPMLCWLLFVIWDLARSLVTFTEILVGLLLSQAKSFFGAKLV